MTKPQWVTNDPKIAKKLIAIDKDYKTSIAKAKHLPLTQFIEEIKKARTTRQTAYENVTKKD